MAFDVIHAPHVNANDLELVVVGWSVEPWQQVTVGDLLAELETTKSTIEICAENDGYIYPAVPAGSKIKVGEPLAWLFSVADPAQLTEVNHRPKDDGSVVISGKARDLMEQFGLSSEDFPRHTAISSDTVIAKVRELGLQRTDDTTTRRPSVVPSFSDVDIVIWGEVNLGSLVWDALDAASAPTLRAAGFVNDDFQAAEFRGLPVFSSAQLSELKQSGLRMIFPCAGGMGARMRQLETLEQGGFCMPNVVHPTGSVSKSARLAGGVFVGAGAHVGPDVEIGQCSVVLSGATVAHHSRLAAFVSISDGAHLGGNTMAGNGVLVGIGASVNKRVELGAGAILVSGSVAVTNLPAGSVLRLDGSIHPLSDTQHA